MELTPDEQRTRHDQRAHLTPDEIVEDTTAETTGETTDDLVGGSPSDLELRVSHWGFRIQEEED